MRSPVFLGGKREKSLIIARNRNRRTAAQSVGVLASSACLEANAGASGPAWSSGIGRTDSSRSALRGASKAPGRNSGIGNARAPLAFGSLFTEAEDTISELSTVAVYDPAGLAGLDFRWHFLNNAQPQMLFEPVA
jgi:hypothetical protein